MKPIIGITADMDENIYKLKQDYISSVAKSSGLPLILAPIIDNASRIADIIDGLLLPGGDDLLPEYYGEDISVPLEKLKFVKKERSDFEIAILKEIAKRQKPVLAICYGMQLVNVAFGGSLYQDMEMQVKGAVNHKTGQHAIKIDESFCSIFNIPQSAISLQDPVGSQQLVNSSHHQAVKVLADGFEVFAVSEDGIVEGFYKKDYPFFICVQWHPERIFYDKLSLGIFEEFIKKSH
ncbi:MAG: gamma-glutamyl-gamma-aminobutyrate hydrolase family protein [Nitrospirota bacterium]